MLIRLGISRTLKQGSYWEMDHLARFDLKMAVKGAMMVVKVAV